MRTDGGQKALYDQAEALGIWNRVSENGTTLPGATKVANLLESYRTVLDQAEQLGMFAGADWDAYKKGGGTRIGLMDEADYARLSQFQREKRIWDKHLASSRKHQREGTGLSDNIQKKQVEHEQKRLVQVTKAYEDYAKETVLHMRARLDVEKQSLFAQPTPEIPTPVGEVPVGGAPAAPMTKVGEDTIAAGGTLDDASDSISEVAEKTAEELTAPDLTPQEQAVVLDANQELELPHQIGGVAEDDLLSAIPSTASDAVNIQQVVEGLGGELAAAQPMLHKLVREGFLRNIGQGRYVRTSKSRIIDRLSQVEELLDEDGMVPAMEELMGRPISRGERRRMATAAGKRCRTHHTPRAG